MNVNLDTTVLALQSAKAVMAENGPTEFRRLRCDFVDPIKTDAAQWAEGPLAAPAPDERITVGCAAASFAAGRARLMPVFPNFTLLILEQSAAHAAASTWSTSARRNRLCGGEISSSSFSKEIMTDYKEHCANFLSNRLRG
jgi:hypothetical protein